MSFFIAINLRPPLRNHLEELGNGAKRQGREEAQGTDQQNDEHEQEYEHAVGGRQGVTMQTVEAFCQEVNNSVISCILILNTDSETALSGGTVIAQGAGSAYNGM